MNLIDAAIPLAIGLFLVMRPQALLKRGIAPEEIAKRSVTLRRVGYVLLGVGVLYAVIVLMDRILVVTQS